MTKPSVEKVKVFISSAMRKTGGIDWPALRGELYEEFSADEQFAPFGIENEASSKPSLQFFLSQVE